MAVLAIRSFLSQWSSVPWIDAPRDGNTLAQSHIAQLVSVSVRTRTQTAFNFSLL